jgi:S-adenosylmethionine:tRNA ribosyltransferase-isomerase
MVAEKEGQFYFFKSDFPVNQIKSVLQKYGQTPLPPYIKNSKLTEAQRRKEYQSVFAKQGLSVAAPTASLHFTKRLISKLKKQGIEVKFVTLNVNLGTFAPLKQENLNSGKLHSETYEVDKKTAADLNAAKKKGKKIIAVGTTVIRTLESAAKNNKLVNLSGQTRLFIQPGYNFKFIDGCITNFHVPKSSLMMLISALVGRKKLLSLYQKAIKQKLRFFSFGDGMLILP